MVTFPCRRLHSEDWTGEWGTGSVNRNVSNFRAE